MDILFYRYQMAEEEELREEIDDLKDQVSSLENMLENLMDVHKNVLEKVSVNSDMEKKYLEMLSLYKRFGHISPSLIMDTDDPISEDIVELLLDSSGLNITQITERLREKRGRASRHTVRERLQGLEKEGVITRTEGDKGKNYSLSDRTIDKWAKLLGIKK